MDLAEVPVRQRALLREHLYPDDHRTLCFHLGIVSELYSELGWTERCFPKVCREQFEGLREMDK